MADLPCEPGWYRLTDHGWERVDDEVAQAEVASGGGWDLVCVQSSAMALAETPLF